MVGLSDGVRCGIVRAMESRMKIKICGITTAADAAEAARRGADAIGLNFYEKSPRHVDPANVPEILRVLPPFVEPVGVYVGLRLGAMAEHASRLGLRSVQWHGDNADREAGSPPLHRLIAAFAVRERSDLEAISRYLDACRQSGGLPTAVLIDAQAPGQYGGTGKTAPWHLLADFRPDIPVILAGGLTPDNVAEAIRIVRPYGVDVASGVEARPGIKDADKVRRFIEKARSVEV
jgi:phosphoribosylanthranilate isomerase